MKIGFLEKAINFDLEPFEKEMALKRSKLKEIDLELYMFETSQELDLICCIKYKKENPSCMIARCDYCCEMQTRVNEYYGVPNIL